MFWLRQLFNRVGATLCALLFLLGVPAAFTQGQDSTPGERNLLIMAELLPGTYDNINQNYFDIRRKLSDADRHPHVNSAITRVSAPAMGDFVFLWRETFVGQGAASAAAAMGGSSRDSIVTLQAGPGAEDVTMKRWTNATRKISNEEIASLTPQGLLHAPACEFTFKRRADHFAGRQAEKACRREWRGQQVYSDHEISLSRSSLWLQEHEHMVRSGERVSGVTSGEPYWLERARQFHCYVDVPGVGGGRDIPFNRYDDLLLHDKGGTVVVRTRDATPIEIYLRLQAVTWHVLNEASDNFNRNSLVLYAYQKEPDGTMVKGSYVFTDLDATRIGNNLGWMLVNCSVTKRAETRPEM